MPPPLRTTRSHAEGARESTDAVLKCTIPLGGGESRDDRPGVDIILYEKKEGGETSSFCTVLRILIIFSS